MTYFFLQNTRNWTLLICAICYVRPYHSHITSTRDGNTFPVVHGVPQSYPKKDWRWLILQIISIVSVCMTKIKLNHFHFEIGILALFSFLLFIYFEYIDHMSKILFHSVAFFFTQMSILFIIQNIFSLVRFYLLAVVFKT